MGLIPQQVPENILQEWVQQLVIVVTLYDERWGVLKEYDAIGVVVDDQFIPYVIIKGIRLQ